MGVVRAGMTLTDEVLKPNVLAKQFGILQKDAKNLAAVIRKDLASTLERVPGQDEISFSVGNIAKLFSQSKTPVPLPAIIVRYFKQVDGKKIPISTNFIMKPRSLGLDSFMGSLPQNTARVKNDLNWCIGSLNNMD